VYGSACRRCKWSRGRGVRPGGAAALLLLLPPPVVVHAAAPCVQFDVPGTIACRDVTPADFQRVDPEAKLVEARLPVSSLIADSQEAQVRQYIYHVLSPRRTAQIVDYLPKTTLASSVIGTMEVTRKEESTASLGLTAALNYQSLARGETSLGSSEAQGTSIKYQTLPPLSVSTASGTMQRGAGAYFKLRPTDQTSLDGSREFCLVLRVPAAWRGDYVYVSCTATAGKPATANGGASTPCGGARFLVALHLEGDQRAQLAAEQLVRAERRLRQSAASHRRALLERSYPSLVHRLAAGLEIVEPKIPPQWLEQVLASPTDQDALSFEPRLPDEVRAAVAEYRRARRTLLQLDGHHAAGG